MDIEALLQEFNDNVATLTIKISTLPASLTNVQTKISALEKRLSHLEDFTVDAQLNSADRDLLYKLQKLQDTLQGVKDIEVKSVLAEQDRRMLEKTTQTLQNSKFIGYQLPGILGLLLFTSVLVNGYQVAKNKRLYDDTNAAIRHDGYLIVSKKSLDTIQMNYIFISAYAKAAKDKKLIKYLKYKKIDLENPHIQMYNGTEYNLRNYETKVK